MRPPSEHKVESVLLLYKTSNNIIILWQKVCQSQVNWDFHLTDKAEALMDAHLESSYMQKPL